MVVLHVKPTLHSLELLNEAAARGGGQYMVCSCGWQSPTVDNSTVRALGREHLREKNPPFFGFWREHMGSGGARRNVLLMPTRHAWAYLFRDDDGGR